jgi:hypothetical protein
MSVRAKFVVAGINQQSKTSKQITLSAVTTDDTPENQRFHKYTPSGTITMQVDNPPAADAFEFGKAFYVDFTPAE